MLTSWYWQLLWDASTFIGLMLEKACGYPNEMVGRDHIRWWAYALWETRVNRPIMRKAMHKP